MKSVLILQNKLVEYRRAIFNFLAAYYDVVILHSGRPATGVADHYREIIVPQTKLGPFHFQRYATIRETQQRFDVVIAMFDLHWPAYLLSLLYRERPKYILFGHRYSGNWIANVLRDSLMRRADRLLMYGAEEIGRMIERGIDPGKIVVAPNTIHVANHEDHSGALKRSLLFVGRLQERKRIDLIIESFARLQGRISDEIVLDIVGSGKLETALQRRAIDLGLSRKVVFHGRIDDHERLSTLFSDAYAYVSPGPVGLGVLHSFAYGVPVLTMRSGRHGPEFHNLRHAHNAMICESVENLDEAMEWVCNEPGLARELGRNAYSHYRGKRTLEHMIAGFRKAIEE